jgi:DNA ligase-1
MKPMLAATATVADIEALLAKGPLIATPKLDGIRCLVEDGKLLSRSLKPIPNRFINEQLCDPWLEGLDGELMIGSGLNFQETTSGVMRESGEPNFSYWVFDMHDTNWSYLERVTHLQEGLRAHARVHLVPRFDIVNRHDLGVVETKVLESGFEGLILRHPDGRYKFGRSTVKEAGMLKLKRFEDSEAVIVGYEAEMENTNPKMTNELGRSKRSSAKGGMVAKDTLGNLLLEDPKHGWKFSLGSGFDDKTAAELWARRDTLIGCLAKYKFFPIGVKDAPRFPVFLGIRDPRDMS